MNIPGKSYYFFLLLSSLLLGACSSSTATKENYSGFLPDYSKLEKVKLADGSATMRWESSDLGEKTYTKLFIDPIIVYPKPQDTTQVDAKLVQEAAAYLEKTVRARLGKIIEIVDAPEANTLRLRAAITAVDTRAVDLKAYEVIPIAAIAAGISSASGARDRHVEVFLEAELSDISNNKILAQAVRKGISDDVLENNKTKVEMAQMKPMLDKWADHAVHFVTTTILKK